MLRNNIILPGKLWIVCSIYLLHLRATRRATVIATALPLSNNLWCEGASTTRRQKIIINFVCFYHPLLMHVLLLMFHLCIFSKTVTTCAQRLLIIKVCKNLIAAPPPPSSSHFYVINHNCDNNGKRIEEITIEFPPSGRHCIYVLWSGTDVGTAQRWTKVECRVFTIIINVAQLKRSLFFPFWKGPPTRILHTREI